MKGDTAELRDWWTVKTKHGHYYLMGYTYNDSRASDHMEWGSTFVNGHLISTTPIVSIDGDLALTKSGTVYKLNPMPDAGKSLDDYLME